MPLPLFFRSVVGRPSLGASPSSEGGVALHHTTNSLARRLSIKRRRRKASITRSNEGGGVAPQGLSKSEKRE